MDPELNIDLLELDDEKPDETPEPNAWSPDEYKLKYQDEEIVPKSKEELINLAQLGVVYNKKKDHYSQIEKERNEIEERLSDPELQRRLQIIQSNPEVFERILNEVSGEGDDDDDFTDPKIKELESKLSKFDTMFDNISKEKEDQELNIQMTNLCNKYKNYDWETQDEQGRTLITKVLEHSYNNNIPNVETAFRDYMFDNALKIKEEQTIKKTKSKSKDKQPLSDNEHIVFDNQKRFNGSLHDLSRAIKDSPLADKFIK